MSQDVAAARIVFGCGAPLVQLPCMGVVSHFVTTGPELEVHMRGKNSLCDYLLDLTTSEALFYGGNDCWSRIVWDVTAVAWLLAGITCATALWTVPLWSTTGRTAFPQAGTL